MHRSNRLVLAFFSLLLFAGPAAAQIPADAEEMLRRIFASGDFSGERFGPARWMDGGDGYTTVEASEAVRDAREIVRYDAASGSREVLVSAADLTPPGRDRPLEIHDYGWSPDGAKLLLFTNSERVWRDNTRGDYWVLDLASGALHQLGGPDAAPSTLMFAKFDPAGERVAYVREGDLYVETLGGEITRLTTRASEEIVNGTSDWVYEEEFFLRDAFRWSPDGEAIAYWQFDMSGVRDFLMINNTDSLYSYTIPVQYPKVGTTNSAVRAGVIPAEGGPTVWLDIPGDPRDNYLPRMEWAASSGTLVLQRLNRAQNTNRVMLADAETGRVREHFVERDSTWLDVVSDWGWLGDGASHLWASQRDGWRHLYAVSRKDGEAELLTPGAYDVVEVVSVDEEDGWIYFIASPDEPTERYLHRVPLEGGPEERVTPAGADGWHSYDVAPGAGWAFHTFSTIDEPPTTELVRLPEHEVVRTLVENRKLKERVEPLIHRSTEFFRVEVADGVELDGWMLRPPDFDPEKRYPLLMYVYTEPWGQTAVNRWGGSRGLWHRMLADQGYVVATVDNRGTPSPRGRAWRKAAYKSIGTLTSRDQAEAVRALLRERPYLDSTRVGVWGWSGGGSATLNAIFRYPDDYDVGMAVAPVPDQRLYDTAYQERYSGLPWEDPESYRRGSPIHFAEGLEGDLLVVHGTADDNVHWQGTERLVNRLVELGKAFDYMVYPNRSHCICEGRGTTHHLFSLLTRYLLDHLPSEPRG